MGKKVEFKVCGLTAKYFVPLFLVSDHLYLRRLYANCKDR